MSWLANVERDRAGDVRAGLLEGLPVADDFEVSWGFAFGRVRKARRQHHRRGRLAVAHERASRRPAEAGCSWIRFSCCSGSSTSLMKYSAAGPWSSLTTPTLNLGVLLLRDVGDGDTQDRGHHEREQERRRRSPCGPACADAGPCQRSGSRLASSRAECARSGAGTRSRGWIREPRPPDSEIPVAGDTLQQRRQKLARVVRRSSPGRCRCWLDLEHAAQIAHRLERRAQNRRFHSACTRSCPPTSDTSSLRVPSAISLPWSMIPMRLQKRSASSM